MLRLPTCRCPAATVTASNQLYTFISGAALPLVILLTTLSTLAAAALFPKIVLLISVCAGLLSTPQVSSAVAAMQSPASPAAALFTKHALFWCLAPTLLGCVAARKLPSRLQAVARGVSVPLSCCCVLVTASNKTALNAGLVNQVCDRCLGIPSIVQNTHANALLMHSYPMYDLSFEQRFCSAQTMCLLQSSSCGFLVCSSHMHLGAPEHAPSCCQHQSLLCHPRLAGPLWPW